MSDDHLKLKLDQGVGRDEAADAYSEFIWDPVPERMGLGRPRPQSDAILDHAYKVRVVEDLSHGLAIWTWESLQLLGFFWCDICDMAMRDGMLSR